MNHSFFSAGDYIEQYLNSKARLTSLQIIEFGLDYLATMVLLQVTLERLNLSDDMKYSADHFEKAHDRLHMNRNTSVNSNTFRTTQQVVKLLDFRSDLPSRVFASMPT